MIRKRASKLALALFFSISLGPYELLRLFMQSRWKKTAWANSMALLFLANQKTNSIRNRDSFFTHLSLCSSSRTPLLTFWTAGWCPTCRTVEPLLRDLVASGVGEAEGGVAFAEVEFDAPDLMVAAAEAGGQQLAMAYMITSVPTLLSFDAGEAQTATKLTDARKMADRQFLVEWICREARRQGGRGGGGGGGGGGALFGGLFGGR